ncbi:heterokaryon incompatibility protein-domain-containing protein [Xylaria intraflava]|nr:heterokaryon incompatibility protein-domain-containing protein [Xylaria intraflava]
MPQESRVEPSQSSVVAHANPREDASKTKGEIPAARLCQRCVDIDVDELLSHKQQQAGVDREIYVRLGDTDLGSFTTWCDLCQFFKSASPPSGPGASRPLVFKNVDVDRKAYHSFPDPYWARPFSHGQLVVAAEDTSMPGGPHYAGGYPFCTVDPRNSVGRLIEPDRVDYDLLRGWIKSCEASHSECSDKQFFPRNVIDCKQRNIISLKEHVPYVALSYVWGKSSASDDEPSAPYSLPAKLPATIEDAIKVSLALQYGYLWVDRYCINQHGGDEKAKEIARMDEIYRGAEVVLVDVAAADPSFGLPGVSRPRNTQPRIALKSTTLASLLSYPINDIRQSRWSKRAWTYQEGALARRRLFFTNNQVYFECQVHACTETLCQTLTHECGSGPGTAPSMHGTGSWQNPGAAGTMLVNYYLRNYSQRSLSFSSDILNGFRGIFNALEKRDVPTFHCGGIPILTSGLDNEVSRSEANMVGFLRGLCWWSPRDIVLRRPDFPSWSWTGWECLTGAELNELAIPVQCLLKRAYVICSDRTTHDPLGFDSEGGEQSILEDIQYHVSPSPGAIYMTGKVVTFRTLVSGDGGGDCPGWHDIWFGHKNKGLPPREGCRMPSFVRFFNVGAYQSESLRPLSVTPEGLTLSAVTVLGHGLFPNPIEHISSRNEKIPAKVILIMQLLRHLPEDIRNHEPYLKSLAGEYKVFERVGYLEVEFSTVLDYQASDWFLEAAEENIVIV